MKTYIASVAKRSSTNRMKSDRAKELFRIPAARKMRREQNSRRSGVGEGKKSSFSTPSPLLPHFCSRLTSRAAELLSPHFSCGPNAKKLFRAVRFHLARTRKLVTQAKTYTSVMQCGKDI